MIINRDKNAGWEIACVALVIVILLLLWRRRGGGGGFSPLNLPSVSLDSGPMAPGDVFNMTGGGAANYGAPVVDTYTGNHYACGCGNAPQLTMFGSQADQASALSNLADFAIGVIPYV